MSRNFTPVQQIEQTIVRRYHEQLWSPFCKAIKRYELIQPGDRIAQLVILPFLAAEFDETDTLPSTERGTGGFGSTGK